MKKILLGLMLLSSFCAFATEYCFDQAVFSVYDLKEKIEKCDSDIPTKRLDTLIDKLQGSVIGYGSRVRKAMKKTYEYMHTDMIYKYAQDKDESVKKCLRRLEYKPFDAVKVEVMDAMVLCGL